MARVLVILALVLSATHGQAARMKITPRPTGASALAEMSAAVSAITSASSVATFSEVCGKANVTESQSHALMEVYTASDSSARAAMHQRMQEHLERMQACGEACVDPVTAEAAMQAAIDAAKLAVGVVSNVTTHVLEQLQSARQDIAQWASKISELSEVNIEEYTIKVARATVAVNQAESRAKAMYESILDITEMIIEDLSKLLDQGDLKELDEGIASAQEAMSIALEGAIEELTTLKTTAAKAMEQFAEVGALSANYEQIITDHIDEKDGWLKAKKGTLRAAVYGGCVASAICGPLCLSACYGIGAPILETQLHALSEDLKSTKNALRTIANRFKTLKNLSGTMEAQAQMSLDNMVEVNVRLKKTARLVRNQNVRWWKSYVMKDLNQLTKILREKLGRE